MYNFGYKTSIASLVTSLETNKLRQARVSSKKIESIQIVWFLAYCTVFTEKHSHRNKIGYDNIRDLSCSFMMTTNVLASK